MINTQTSRFGPYSRQWIKGLYNHGRIVSWFQAMSWLIVACVCAACGNGADAFAPALPPSQLLARLRLNENVLNMALAPPYDTAQLRVTAYSGTGKIIEGDVEYSVELPAQDKMTISPAGLLNVNGSGTNMIVRARMNYNGVTLTDSAYVNVIAGTPTNFVKHMGFGLTDQDSAKVAVYYSALIPIIRQDSTDSEMPSLGVQVWLSDPSIANSWFYGLTDGMMFLEGVRPGRMTVYASTYAYGMSFRDSLEFQVGWPIRTELTAVIRYVPGSFDRIAAFHINSTTVGTGACVIWRNPSDLPIDVTFDDPSGVDSPSATGDGLCTSQGRFDMNGGNIAPFKREVDSNGVEILFANYRTRVFKHPGVYTYHSSLYGTKGTIIVCDEKQNNPKCAPENYTWLVIP